ncbi:MAG: AMP-binding protein [Prosthecobacter sp.]
MKKGDRGHHRMPMIPEALFAMPACTRIGAVHSVIFGGFSAESIKDRVLDSGASIIITADGGYRRGCRCH